MPWVHYQRSESGDRYLNCEQCTVELDEQIRATWHCGWLPSDSWTGYGFPPPEGWPEFTACPGYSTQLPAVLEGARALSWAQRGSLRDFYDVPLTDLVRAAVDIVDSEKNAVERHLIKKARKKQKT